MRNVLLLASMLFATGCPGFCGGFAGGDDHVYQRGSESLILCDNGGFVANTRSGSLEGRYMQDENGQWFATRGDDGQLAFDISYNADGSVMAPQLGATAWTSVALDATALDHADVQCQDLETRAWWTAQ
jgi:hypothetical protein